MGGLEPLEDYLRFWLTIFIVAGTLFVLLTAFVFLLGYTLCFRSLVQAVEPEFRHLRPSSVWLLFVPGFNIIWHLWLIVKLGKSYRDQIKHTGTIPREKASDIKLGAAIFVLNVIFLLVFALRFPFHPSHEKFVDTILFIFFVTYAGLTPALIVAHLFEMARLRKHLYR